MSQGTMNILAVLLSPVIAVAISIYIQSRKERRAPKQWIFGVLIATRHSPITDECVRALNSIDVAFHRSPKVRRLWHEYFEMLNNAGLNNDIGVGQRQKKNLEMLTEMAKDLGYGTITHLDVDRVYYPVGLGAQSDRAEAISNELLRVLKASGGFQVIPRDEGRAAAALATRLAPVAPAPRVPDDKEVS